MTSTVIVGAGIAGLWLAEQLVAAGVPAVQIQILEKYNYIGGRVVSHPDGYEIGAGRIHASHRRTLALIRRAGQGLVPIAPRLGWHATPTAPITTNMFDTVFANGIAPLLQRLPADMLATHTVRQLLNATIGTAATAALLNKYPYRAETEMLRADLALQALSADGEMGSNAGFYTVRGGLGAVVRKMAAGLRAAGVSIHLNTTVRDVRPLPGSAGSYRIFHTGQRGPGHTDAARVILATHISAIRQFRSVRSAFAPALRHLTMEPLTRIYAKYPVSPVWFADLPKTVTPGPLRYIIPINPATGLIMISYTDARDTTAWHGLRGPELTAAIQTAVRAEFPDRVIPEPIWVRSYEWHDGCTYWRPGHYDPHAVAAAVRAPPSLPGLYCCGESLSVGRQAWIEGALESAAALWATIKKTNF